jgi:hypothetical protein
VSPRARRLVIAIAAALAVAACESPEARRGRGSGPGADVGNRGPTVQMHEGSRPYWETPRLLGDRGMADLSPAQQARQLSRGDPGR